MLSSLNKRPFAFVDIETTGGQVTRDRITEVAIVTVDQGRVSEWSSLVNPGVPIPDSIRALTGIDDAMVAGAPPFEALAETIWEKLDGVVFVAHNARFDYGFLKNELRRCGFDLKLPQLCTVKLSRKLFPEHQRHNLDSLIERLELAAGTRHRALGDAQAIADLWRKLPYWRSRELIDAAVREQLRLPSLPPFLDKAAVDRLPQEDGVYLFYGENDLPLYVGKSRQVRQRVLAHFAADHQHGREMNLAQQVRRVEAIPCPGEVGALLLESRLVKELQPTFNRQLRRNRELCSWRLMDQGYDLLQPRLVYARDLSFGRQADLYGLFKSAAEAKQHLADLAKEAALCPVVLGLEKGKLGRPCFAHQLHRCQGACCGQESLADHSQRLQMALAALQVEQWPFRGPALLEEGGVTHVIEAWCYLGVVEEGASLGHWLAGARPAFDRDTYRILQAHKDRLEPCHPLLLASVPNKGRLRQLRRAA